MLSPRIVGHQIQQQRKASATHPHLLSRSWGLKYTELLPLPGSWRLLLSLPPPNPLDSGPRIKAKQVTHRRLPSMEALS